MRNYLTRVMSLNRDHSGEFGSKTWTVSMYAVQSAINLLAASARSVNARRVCATVVANRAAGDRGFSYRSGGIAGATVVLRGVGFCGSRGRTNWVYMCAVRHRDCPSHA